MGKHAGMVCVKSFPTEEEAEIAQGLLQSNGLEAIVSDEGADPAREGYSLGAKYKLLVSPKHSEKAAKILSGKK